VSERTQRSSSPLWVAAGAVVSGGATYALLVVAGRALGPASYGEFSLFWAAIIITSMGAFLPVEQVLARRTAGSGAVPGSTPSPLARGLRLSTAIAVGAVVVHTGVWLFQADRHGTEVVLAAVFAFAIASAGFVMQFSARGVLAGRHALREYVIVIAVDALVRATAAIALWAAGITSVGAYMIAVGVSSLTCGVVGLVFVHRVSVPADLALSDGASVVGTVQLATRPFGREVGGLVVAMLCMQGLLNSGIVVAALAGRGADAVVAGHVLAAITLARLPVFVLQSAQAAYVSRIAALQRRRDGRAVRGVLVWLATAVGGVATATILVAAVLGPFIVRIVFGPDFGIARSATTLVALGVGAYLVASVSNDVAVALGAHHRVGRAWVAGAGAAIVIAVLVPDLTFRTTLPLLVGSVIAAGMILPVVAARGRTTERP
jgi:O-antigen/teichoic acid export membrane protein